MDRTSPLRPGRTGRGSWTLPLFGALLALAAVPPSSNAAGLPAGVTAQQWLDARPRTPEEIRRLVREARALRFGETPATPGSSLANDGPVDGVWQEWAPPSRAYHGMVYDSRRDRLVVVGGDLWTPAGNSWVLPLAGTPRWQPFPAANLPVEFCRAAAAIYDSTTDRILAVLIVGAPPDGWSDRHAEVWALSLSGAPAWTLLHAAAPGVGPAGNGLSLAADEANGRWLVAEASAYFEGRIWQFRPADAEPWTLLADGGPAAGDGLRGGIVWDAARSRAVVSTLTGVWAVALEPGIAWTPLAEIGRYASDLDRLLRDPAADEALLADSRGMAARIPLGGGVASFLADSWPQPVIRGGCAVAFDTRRRRLIANGGRGTAIEIGNSSTLAHGLGGFAGWEDLRLDSGGVPLGTVSLVDSDRDRLILFGGTPWVYTADSLLARPLGDPQARASWIVPVSGPRPLGAIGAGFLYDPLRRRALLIGGQSASGSAYSDEVWELTLDDPPAWNRLAPGGTGPGPIVWPSAYYDPLLDRIVVLDAGYAKTVPTRAWELRLSPALEWRPLAVGGEAAGIFLYDIFVDQGTREVWAWAFHPDGLLHRARVTADSVVYSKVPEIGGPGLDQLYRFNARAYDPSRRRLVVFEEDYGMRDRMDGYWAVTVGDVATWAWKRIDGTHPYDRSGIPNTAYVVTQDLARDRLVIHGGYDESLTYFDDWWSLNWDRPTPVLASLVDARVEGGCARLAWQLGGDPVASLTIERRTAREPWTALATLGASGGGRVSYEDAALEPGVRYGWRLIANGEPLGETWLDVPAAAALALGGATACPVEGPLDVAFSLDRPGAATLELFDLGGRRIVERRLQASAAGAREERLAARGALEPGVYFLRLVAAGGIRTARVIVVR